MTSALVPAGVIRAGAARRKPMLLKTVHVLNPARRLARAPLKELDQRPPRRARQVGWAGPRRARLQSWELPPWPRTPQGDSSVGNAVTGTGDMPPGRDWLVLAKASQPRSPQG